MKLRTAILASLVLIVCSSFKLKDLQTNDITVSNNWKLIKQSKKELWSLYSRAYNGSKYLEFRITGVVNATPKVVFNSAREQLTKDENLPKEMKQTIIEESEDFLLTYYEINMPFVFKDRDLALQYNFYENLLKNSYKIDWIEVPEKAPALKTGDIRIVKSRGKWEFTPSDDESTLVTFTQLGDLGGKMPVRLVNKMSGKALADDLQKLREMVKISGNH